MVSKQSRSAIRVKKHNRMRKNLAGTAARPRLSVFRSEKHIYAQIIDDQTGNTLVAASTVEKAIASKLEGTSNVAAAEAVGTAIAEKAKAKGIEEVVFDRGGFLYHGRVKALADAAREAGLQF
ncbi:50S ribosomal protein L18 [Sporanaerobium hydrogeniformans]|uniref:50S ribosomal protein L18 n=1 Tax=Sporanaerobium hydrogeniformans TaxID=3072179 RepID=A0AC61DFF9_9FIRM|nr:50S ribosomal protein L18 [Sporanaerobium hydrogeniformans]PHV71317.1 50S ribosomal protein L18 [Sporanaerobium hydrogeniformans]